MKNTQKSNPSQDSAIDKKTPLSQASGKKKLIVGIPATIICFALFYLEILPGITKMLGVIFSAYVIVGLIEVIVGNSLSSASEKWELMPSWKKFIISTFVIAGFFILVIALMPYVARQL